MMVNATISVDPQDLDLFRFYAGHDEHWHTYTAFTREPKLCVTVAVWELAEALGKDWRAA